MKIIIFILCTLYICSPWCHNETINEADKILCLDYVADGSKLVFAMESEWVKIYSTSSYAQVGSHRRWGYKPTTVRYSPDGTKIAVGYENQ